MQERQSLRQIFIEGFSAVKRGLIRSTDFVVLVAWTTSSSLLAFAGPFGTYMNASFLSLLWIWLVIIGVAIMAAYIVAELCRAFLPPDRGHLFRAVFIGLSSLLIAVLIAAMQDSLLAVHTSQRHSFLTILGLTFTILSLVIALRILIGVDNADGSPKIPLDLMARATEAEQARCRLAERLDIPAGCDILYVRADGHFVEVQTSAENFRARMRFADAVAQLDDAVGITVHRSHWVKRRAISGWVPDAQKPYIVLHNEARVPVSKTHFEKVENEGFRVIEPSDEMAVA